MTSEDRRIDFMAGMYALSLVNHFLSLIPEGPHKHHTDIGVIVYEDSNGFFIDEEWTPEIGTGAKGVDGKRGTI